MAIERYFCVAKHQFGTSLCPAIDKIIVLCLGYRTTSALEIGVDDKRVHNIF